MHIGPTTLILTISMTIGVIAGFVMHRSDYCVTGMFRDAIMFHHTFMLRALLLQIVITMILFEILRQTGTLPFYPFPLLGKPSLANIMGGVVFGIGMVLAGGCVVGTLYKMGAGSVTSFFAFLGLIFGSGLYPEIHPQWANIVKTTSISEAITLPQLLAINPLVMVVAVAIPAIILFSRWHRQQLWGKEAVVAGYLQPWKAACILTLLGAVSYILLGMPLGISTTYTKIAAITETLIIPEHAESLAYFKGVPLNIYNQLLNTPLHGGAGPAIDSLWDIQFPLIIGITIGSTFSAMLLGEFSVRYKVPGKQILTAFLGGTIMGFGARMSSGCNIWHLMGGIPIFAISSLLFVIGLSVGTWIGAKILFRILTGQHNCSCR
ncbi:MAG: YeeE/YedE family protein [Desulfobulbaceae bacterium]|nr:YeeE/YedE family protein [Desulfobulbaceae bacterium]